MIGIVDSAATVAFVAAIDWQAARAALRRGLAIERFGKGSGHAFQFADGIPREKIAVRQSVALQAALKQLRDVGLFCKIGKHGSVSLFRRFLSKGFDGQRNAGQRPAIDRKID